MIINFNDFINLNEEYSLNDSLLLNEKLSFNDIKNHFKKYNKNIVNKLLKKFNNSNSKIIKKNIILFLFSILLLNSDLSINNNEIDNLANNLSAQKTLTETDVLNYIYYQEKSNELDKKNNFNLNIDDVIYKNPQLLLASDEIKKFIKKQEHLSLTAYDIGDGKITIGYGHSEFASDSIYNIGDSITIEQANIIFENDIKYFEKSIKRMFKQWDKKGYNVKITQGMFDALISMSYNTGITKLRNTEFIEHLMNGEFDTAAEKIPNTIINNVDYPGLQDRREKEQDFFIKDIS